MRRLLIAGALAILLTPLVACGGSNEDLASQAALQQKADYWEIDQIERTFHEATTQKDIEMMMSLWAPDATLTSGRGETAVGLEEIRRVWLRDSMSFDPHTHWVSDHPAYKVEITVNGDRGTLHFECHYLDYDTNRVAYVTVADLDVARIEGRWLITNFVGASTELEP
jgi:ketosteroid isomerase-like protein